MTYMTTADFAERNDLTLNTTDFPTSTLVQKWIDEATLDINDKLERDFTLDDYEDELDITQYTQVFFIKNPPINSATITALYNSTYDEFSTPTWTSTDIVVLDSKIGAVKVKVPQVFRAGSVLKVSYNGGYATTPNDIFKLTRLLVQREYINTQLQQEVGDATTTSIASIRVSEKSATGMNLQLTRLDKEIENLYNKLKGIYYIGTYEGIY